MRGKTAALESETRDRLPPDAARVPCLVETNAEQCSPDTTVKNPPVVRMFRRADEEGRVAIDAALTFLPVQSLSQPHLLPPHKNRFSHNEMEPRIRSLLLDDSLAIDRFSQDQLSFQLPQQQHSLPHHASRPAPVEPSAPRPGSFALHDIYSPTSKDHGIFSSQRPAIARHPADPTTLQSEQRNSVSRPTQSAPLAEVLNNEQASSSFSGSVNDLLLDDDAPNKRRKVDGNEIFTLPKPFPVKKGSRRPRIPPLLQGLHQPPPDAGLFPPITGERVSREAPKVLTDSKSTETTEGPPKSAGAKESEQSAAAKEKGPTKRRKKWTEDETTDLLRGVARFGIGNWKKILSCPDYTFDGRTAVDLKDRFRTCCPEEYRKLKAPSNADKDKSPNTAESETSNGGSSNKPASSLVVSNILHPSPLASIPRPEKKKRGPKVHRKDLHDLASIGIDAPFKKKVRRERREFTEQEDAALLRGVEKLGPHWHAIRNDPELELTSRHPTDLRDRFRNRWPEKYAEAGYKIQLKGKSKKDGEDTSATESPMDKTQAEKSSTQDDAVALTSAAPSTTQVASANKARAPTDLKALLTNYPFHDPFQDTDEDFASDLPFGGECSPVILSREIFSYAHPNGNQLPSTVDLSGNGGTDNSHINPLDTLKIPRLSTSHHSSSTSLPPVWLTAPLTAGLTEANSSSNNPKSRSDSRNLGSELVSGAGSGSSNAGAVSLPGPADLLMGLDFDGRDAHGPGSGSFLWDELPGPSSLS
ncbi:uncharacterized protein K452DRAFT_305274 [Aplosporella prunicola CBS 121167]|uniref:Myb-like domain-containing protein n=1 Tax=Aplosporella prunicola CBS 121167 TaxID=1176127 RepID=A0A6A6BUJ4_9PEZI|nr:uncharacterized protein K452DRAFT_305274 [Aplosporella prunicola CBS 121167]KAF2146331.1 hypothetical protein K452DRAFT_305274 [Aplosporella prunicola CBS 121167]